MNILNTKQCILTLTLCVANLIQAKTIYVHQSSSTPTAPYTNATTAAHTIQIAIDATEDGDEVILYPGTYTPSATLVVTNNIFLRGFLLSLENADNFIINAEHSHKVLDLGTNACQVVGLTIKNGNGGGIHCDDNTPLVWNCIISGNENGGGMYNGSANGCIFTNNSSYYGAGANLTEAEFCLFVGNSARYGGGMQGGSAYRCIFRNNTATYGAGIKDGTARGCTFIENNALTDGGGAYQSTLNQCALTANSANDKGGGSYNSTANNCTFTDNTAFNSGGGMQGGTANNSILWNNHANLQDNNIEGGTQTHYSCYPEARTDDGLHNITNNPLLISFSHISTTSPCIGAGSTNYLTHLTDIDGEGWNPTPPMGCDEIQTTIGGEITPILLVPERVAATEEIYFTAYIEGAVTQTILDFGDGTTVTNPIGSEISHTFAYGNYEMVLTGYNDDYPGGVSVSNIVYSQRDITTTIYVSLDGDDSYDGESWANAKQTIQAGVDAQEWAGGLVLVSNGTYSITSEIIVSKDLRIQSLSGLENTVIQGDNHHQNFSLNNQHCRIEGFTIQNAGGYSVNGSSGGGAIHCAGSNPVVANCLITQNNSGGYGGGVMWRGTASHCVFSNNSGGNGPGAMATGIAIDCLFENNHGLGGGTGGGAMSGGIATRCIFKNNTNVKSGGAMNGGVATDCQFIGNHSNYQGGGMNGGTAINCVFNGNRSNTTGGGMYGGSATHCTFTANRAIDAGGTYNVALDHCIVWFNEALQSFENIASGTATDSCSPDLEHGSDGNITNNPQLVSASHIAVNSPCAGSGIILRDTVDIDGEHWRSNPAMGCDEPADSPSGDLAIIITGPEAVPAGFKAFFDVDIQGALSSDFINFGDGQTAIHGGIRPTYHIWTTPGIYNLVVTAYNADYPGGYSVSKQVQVFASDFAATYVSTNGNDSADGYSWATAKQTIQAGIDAQQLSGGKVIVSNGVYQLAATILIEKDIQLLSVNGAKTTIIDGVDLYSLNYQHSRIMEIGDNHSTIDGFTLRNANYSWTGGAIFCDYTHSPILSNCIIADNHAGTAGGMCYGTVIDCTFSNNTASVGAGLYLGHATRCEFIANTASSSGGGMYGGTADHCSFVENRTGNAISYGNGAGMSKGAANNCTFTRNDSDGYGGGMNEGTANDCVFIENTAVHGGGGIRSSIGNRCSFFGNSASTHGGAIYNSTATRCVVNGNQAETGGGMHSGNAYSCSFSGNKAYGIGGATHSTKLFNCTVTGNTANEAGGVYGQPKNCIVWGNSATTGQNDINDGNIYLNYIINTCSPDAPNGTDGCITNNPLLVSGSHISTTSPCLGKGNAAYAAGTDLDGETWNTLPAMGCDEVGATLSGPIEMALYGPSPIRVYTEGSYSALFEGQVSQTIVDFGDSTMITNGSGTFSHTWKGSTRDQKVVLTGFNDTYPLGISYTQIVEVVSTDDSDIHVHSSRNDNNDGKSWGTAKKTIQAGIDAQNVYGGRVLIDGNTYLITKTILVNKPILLKGYNSDGTDGLIPIIDAGESNRCFNLGYSDCVLENLTLRNGAASTLGYSNNEGGGIYCRNGAPRITYSTIENCVAYFGAGVYRGTLENCTLSGNVATQGGAAYESTLTDSTIVSNSAQYGGGVAGGTMIECVLSNNTATTVGGGAYNSTVTFSTVTDNTAPSGGGLASCTADRCDILFNYATAGHGGGLHKGTAHNSTIHNNAAIQYGGGTYNTSLRNCTVVENGAENGGGVYGSSIYNSIVWSNVVFTTGSNTNIASASTRNCCSPDLTLSSYYGNITNAPQFISYPPGMVTRGSDYYLANLSSCINAGKNDYVTTEKDYNGWGRILHGTVDIGACEMYVGGDSDSDGIGDGWELENFGGVTNAVATANADTDPHNNYEEYIAGTDPFDSNSYLRITQQEITEDGFVLHWDAVENRNYQVLWTDSLTNDLQKIRPAVKYPRNWYTVEKTNSAAFYKINVWID